MGEAARRRLFDGFTQRDVMDAVKQVYARMLAAPAEVPIGILTAAIGAPFFLAILLRQRSVASL